MVKPNSINKISMLFALIISFLLLFTACSNNADGNAVGNENNKLNNGDPVLNDKNNNTNVNNKEPVTIQFAIPLGEEFFEGRFGPVNDKLEHINIEHVFYGNTLEALE